MDKQKLYGHTHSMQQLCLPPFHALCTPCQQPFPQILLHYFLLWKYLHIKPTKYIHVLGGGGGGIIKNLALKKKMQAKQKFFGVWDFY
jgi:hypothetical protein